MTKEKLAKLRGMGLVFDGVFDELAEKRDKFNSEWEESKNKRTEEDKIKKDSKNSDSTDSIDNSLSLSQVGNSKNTTPPKYKLQTKDNFWNLEKRFGIEHGILKKINPKLNPININEGVEILLPSNIPIQVASFLKASKEKVEEYITETTGHPKNFDISDLKTKKDQELLAQLKNTIRWGTFGYLQAEGDRVVEHFGSNKGTDFGWKIAVGQASSVDEFKKLITSIRNVFVRELKKDITNPYAIIIKEKKEIHMPDFTISFNPNNLIQTSLKTLVGGTQELEIFIDDINISSANVLNAHLSFKLYDNFGVDEGDVIKAIDSDFVSGTNVAVGGVLGLKAFWILQHQRGYKPFRTFFHYALNLNDIKL